MSIILIRHAQSTHNAFGDQTRDCPLSGQGKKDAKAIKGHYDLVICSTLKRACETLEYSSLKYNNIIYTDLCREIRDGNPINLLLKEEESMESYEDIKKRIQTFKDFLKEQHLKYSKIAVISHGVFLGYLSGHPSCNCEHWNYTDL